MQASISHSAFGEIDAARAIFADAKIRRLGRSPAHVMVVEDDPLTRQILRLSLCDMHAMIAEENAHGAMVSYLLHAPDLVFLDIGLPEIDGYALLDQIMAVDPQAYVVMLSSRADSENIHRALTAGAKGYIIKPFQKETLRHHIAISRDYHQTSHR